MNREEQQIAKVLGALQEPGTIRQQASRILALAYQDKLEHFAFDPDRMTTTASYVLEVMKDQYPSLVIPYHSRWRHFAVGGIDRINQLQAEFSGLSPEEQGKILYELVILSVFLDAGSGKSWHYFEPTTGLQLSRSEGLAVASLAFYRSGVLSLNPKKQPLRIDGKRLCALNHPDLERIFQISTVNPLEGFEGRAALLQRLGETVCKQKTYFGHEGRLGDFYSYISSLQTSNRTISAVHLFQAVLAAFAEVWPKRLEWHGVALGDVWPHHALKTEVLGSEWIPFHKLSQWLTYSLIEPLELQGIRITELDELTGLPEYRNGGLLLDMGLLKAKHDDILRQPQEPGSEVIIEWRALTVALLDELAKTIRKELGKSVDELPLAKVLQGGTWEAGRRIAKQKRAGGVPPIQIISDGTLF